MSYCDYDIAMKAFRKFCKRQLKNLKLDTKHEGCNHKVNRKAQKFFIYSHNLDLENALKYHQKLTDIGAELLEIFTEEDGDLTFAIARTGETEDEELDYDSNGYVKFADHLKSQYKCREDTIDGIKTLIANM